MLNSGDIKTIRELIQVLVAENVQAVSDECEGLAVMVASGFGRLDARLDGAQLRLECVEQLIKSPNSTPAQHYILNRPKGALRFDPDDDL